MLRRTAPYGASWPPGGQTRWALTPRRRRPGVSSNAEASIPDERQVDCLLDGSLLDPRADRGPREDQAAAASAVR